MRLDLSSLRYLTVDDFRVLTAIEMGMRNHEIVPVELIESIAKLKRGSTTKIIANLLKHKLVEHSNTQYDGYSLNFIGYDFLSIHALMKRGILVKIGPKLGVGKESDVFICYVNAKNAERLVEENKEISDEEYNKLKEKILENVKDEGSDSDEENEEKEEEENSDEENEEENSDEEINKKKELKKEKTEEMANFEKFEEKNEENFDHMVNKFEEELDIFDIQCHIAILKVARLGRTSFRAVKTKRDYVKNKSHYNWLYLSRLSATNEFKFLNGLYENGYAVPKPYGHNRHIILMQYIPSYPLCRIDDLGDKEKAYNDLTSIICSLASKGLIHGDFNEFNILVQLGSQKIWFIDFPQMISITHEDAEKYFNRDVLCINKFFKKKFGMTFDNNTFDFKEITKKREDYLDFKYKAYGHENGLNTINSEIKEKLKREEQEKRDLEIVDESDENEEDEGDEEEDKEKKKLKKMNKKNKNLKNKIDNFNNDDMDLNFEDELKNINNKIQVEKIEINSRDIRNKVKKILTKQSYATSKGTNRFKGKKKEKISLDK